MFIVVPNQVERSSVLRKGPVDVSSNRVLSLLITEVYYACVLKNDVPLGTMAADRQTEWRNGERLHLDSGQRIRVV